MKRLVLFSSIAFAVTLAAIVAVRLSDQAIALIIGLALGMLSGIPTSLIVVFILRQRDAAQMRQAQQFPGGVRSQQPPVFIVTGAGAGPVSSPWLPRPAPTSLAPNERAFTVVGDESTDA
ncbi:MAG: hypothetical protein ACE5H9_09790 [Anaerolineae bacterium]